MRLYFYGLVLLIKKFILRKNTGECILSFVEKMGVVYIKFAQMLAMQNVGNLFTEEDRKSLSKICDHCNPISFKKIKKQIEKEYGCPLNKKFKKVLETPVGSASISQVHKAILKNGDVVAIKIKRKDVTKRIEHDIKQLRKLVHRYGRFFKFKNYLGGDTALDLYLEWIKEETDFTQEKNNILEYYHFAKSVNGSIPGTKNIVVPKVYKKLCTENIIVMEFIFSKTINQMKLTPQNKEKISNSLNDYIMLSFYALFHDMPVTFHGDPHGGNIYIEQNGNIGFLDMGLIFTFTKEEVAFVRKLFLNAYTCNVEDLTKILMNSSEQKDVDEENLRKEIEKCCKQFSKIPVSQFYMDMIMVYTKFNATPPVIFYKMAKTFVSLFGMTTFLENTKTTEELLQKQIIDFYVTRTMNDIKEITNNSITFVPTFVKNILTKGVTKSIAEQVVVLSEMQKKMTDATEHAGEVLELVKRQMHLNKE